MFEYIEVPNTTDGRYYTYTFTHITPARFPILILRNTQNNTSLSSNMIVFGSVNYNSGAESMRFSDPTVTYNASTKTITIDNGDNAWARPYILYSSGALA